MKKNKLMKHGDSIIRILEIGDDAVLIIDCVHKSMPRWVKQSNLASYENCAEQELYAATGKTSCDYDSLDKESRRFAHEHFTMIVSVLPFVGNEKKRSSMITDVAADRCVSKQTIRNYLWLYLAYQDISALAPKQKQEDRPLTQDEKNMRWALNKFFYTRHKNSLNTAYTLMLKEKYCDSSGVLLSEYPSIHQFKYFYRKYNKMQTYYISREGLKPISGTIDHCWERGYRRSHLPLEQVC